MLAWLVQVVIFRHLVNQEPIILFMATIGLAYFLEGLGDLMWGSDIKKLDVGLPQGINLWIDETTFNIFDYGFFIDNLDIVATIIAALLGWRFWWPFLNIQNKAARCGRWRMITKRHFLLVYRLALFG